MLNPKFGNRKEPYMNQPELFPLSKSELSPGFTIARALPQRLLRRIGAWAFLDHIGPVSLSPDLGMKVRSHPHIGLQTFTWMISGEIQHHDSLGYEQIIRPNEVNLMTAGNGIAHTETSVGNTGRMHAVQLWIALPKSHQQVAPSFEHHPQLPSQHQNGLHQTVLVGAWETLHAPTTVHSPLMAVDMLASSDAQATFALQADFEYGILPLIGQVSVNGVTVSQGQLAYLPCGQEHVQIHAAAGSHFILIGGEPLPEELIVWWNFIARSQAEIEQARTDWEAQSPRFGELSQLGGDWLHAPAITGHLKASGGRRTQTP